MATPMLLSRLSVQPRPAISGSWAAAAVHQTRGIGSNDSNGRAGAATAATAVSALVAAGNCLRPTGAARGAGWKSRARPSTRLSAVGEPRPTLHVGLVGYGLVGQELVAQILAAAPGLESDMGVSVEISAVARSRVMALLPKGSSQLLAGGAWPESQEETADLEKLGKHVVDAATSTGGRALIVDNTASDAPAELYEAWLSAGADVATPNKRAGSGPYDRYERIMAASRKGGTRFLYEATVGAGLPVLGPLKALLQAGDEVDSVEGIFSGTLSYIFNTWKPGVKFSEVVREAKDKGFTEPDPRDDLGGTDVQRKVTILARECGMKLEMEDVPVKSLVPAKLQNWEPPAGQNLGEAFVEGLAEYDNEMDALIEDAEKAGEVLRFVGAVDMKSGKASVKLGRYPKDHPFASTQFADNIVAVSSKWYTPRPLVIQGPGAGASVTAAGVFGNVLEAMNGMRRPS
eukprot:TRINITY_DN5025_c0_g1_i2.p1 TRINITY_DN5025_c0_g1~~TRINITY_DN5025_c0_g1_i2.p1  ORF type:complete len:460 (+),score=87.81 TRINITY_DN5025_c0_g1_i2:58-1437(+)